jgi:hypothetical protein
MTPLKTETSKISSIPVDQCLIYRGPINTASELTANAIPMYVPKSRGIFVEMIKVKADLRTSVVSSVMWWRAIGILKFIYTEDNRGIASH